MRFIAVHEFPVYDVEAPALGLMPETLVERIFRVAVGFVRKTLAKQIHGDGLLAVMLADIAELQLREARRRRRERVPVKVVEASRCQRSNLRRSEKSVAGAPGVGPQVEVIRITNHISRQQLGIALEPSGCEHDGPRRLLVDAVAACNAHAMNDAVPGNQ